MNLVQHLAAGKPWQHHPICTHVTRQWCKTYNTIRLLSFSHFLQFTCKPAVSRVTEDGRVKRSTSQKALLSKSSDHVSSQQGTAIGNPISRSVTSHWLACAKQLPGTLDSASTAMCILSSAIDPGSFYLSLILTPAIMRMLERIWGALQ